MSRSSFAERIKKASTNKKSRIILALDIANSDENLLLPGCSKILAVTGPHICAVKLNLHVLLPLSLKAQRRLVEEARRFEVEVIADLKLNDIASTNLTVSSYLWSAGFDAVIANPIAGFDGGLGPLITDSHEKGKGVLLLTYMSHPGANEVYGQRLGDENVKTLYTLFIEKAVTWLADGVVVGATIPEMIAFVRRSAPELPIYSPGVGVQGGSSRLAVEAGSNYLIVGRKILDSPEPGATAATIRRETWGTA